MSMQVCAIILYKKQIVESKYIPKVVDIDV